MTRVTTRYRSRKLVGEEEINIPPPLHYGGGIIRANFRPTIQDRDNSISHFFRKKYIYKK